MKLTFIGASREVTGSCYYLECNQKKFIVDYGMEQGQNFYENAPLPVSPAHLDFVLLTHAHIDHAGMIPKLYAEGFRGRVICTGATKDLSKIMLRDSAHIQEMEAEWRNRKAKRSDGVQVEPAYTVQDVEGVLKHFIGVDYREKFEVDEGIVLRFIDAGHLLGSASIELWLTEGQTTKKLVFSGDIGNFNKPLIKDPEYIKEADYVITESTYGDRLHPKERNHEEEFAKIIQETLDRGGNVVIPAFAVGRTQELLYYIRKIKDDGLIKNHGDFEVVVDSPLAIDAIEVFKANLLDCFDDETKDLVKAGINPIHFRGLRVSTGLEDSKAINLNSNPKVIISASGMCDAGRIRHHLKHNLWRPESSVIFAGYQSVGTLGRALQDGAKEVRLFGENIAVHAHIETLGGMSGHADRDGLLAWMRAFSQRPNMVFVCHGESQVAGSYADLLKKELKLDAFAPFSGSSYDLLQNRWLEITQGVPIAKKVAAKQRASEVFLRLLSAGERLLRVIHENKGGANKDLAKFTAQIHALCDKWQ